MDFGSWSVKSGKKSAKIKLFGRQFVSKVRSTRTEHDLIQSSLWTVHLFVAIEGVSSSLLNEESLVVVTLTYDALVFFCIPFHHLFFIECVAGYRYDPHCVKYRLQGTFYCPKNGKKMTYDWSPTFYLQIKSRTPVKGPLLLISHPEALVTANRYST